MPRNDNLIPIDERPADEARAIRAAGGRAAAKAKARNNRLRDRLEHMLKQKSDHTYTVVESHCYAGTQEVVSTDGTYYDWMVSKIVSKACNGDMKAIGMILDILGDDTKDSTNNE